MNRYHFGPFPVHSEISLPLGSKEESDEDPIRIHIRNQNIQKGDSPRLPQILARTNGKFVYNFEYGELLGSVRNGRHITVTNSSKGTETVSRFVLSKLLPAAFMQRGHTVLHASSVSYKNEAILILGETGSGKSTLAAALSLRDGFSLLGDDTAPLIKYGKSYRTLCSATYVRLLRETQEFFNFEPRAFLYEKGFCERENDARQFGESFGIRKAFIIRVGDSVRAIPMNEDEKYQALLRSLWFLPLHREAHGKAHLERIKEISRSIDVHVLEFPKSFSFLDEVGDLIQIEQ